MTLWTVAHQTPLSVGVFKQEYRVAISFSRGSSWPRDRAHVSCDSWDSGSSECELLEGWGSLIYECLTCSREGLAQTGDGAPAALWCLSCEHCHVLKPSSKNQKMGHLTGAPVLCQVTVILNSVMYDKNHYNIKKKLRKLKKKLSVICLPDSFLFNKNLPHHLPHSLLKPSYVGRKWELSIF